ncbi:hypothetical protein [Xanthomonas citri]|uniref:hypothetical protein n=1 Tax=Xanthomonas citri TaxID=346 RepID=UPI0018DB0128|nr:hypothetical protein [Xanthomonas citri]WPM78385.1 hypothetical protein XVT_09635 [Xanthomonas citri pv. viticola]
MIEQSEVFAERKPSFEPVFSVVQRHAFTQRDQAEFTDIAGLPRIAQIPKVKVIVNQSRTPALFGQASFCRSPSAPTRELDRKLHIALQGAVIDLRGSHLGEFTITLNEPKCRCHDPNANAGVARFKALKRRNRHAHSPGPAAKRFASAQSRHSKISTELVERRRGAGWQLLERFRGF